MKSKVLLVASLAMLGASQLKAQLNVGSTSAPDASAILQATSTTKGFLPPVMTTGQRAIINAPAIGLTIFNATTNQLEVNTGTTSTPVWVSASSAATYSATSQAVLKSNANMTGGGNRSYKAGNVLWDSRFLVIGNGSGAHFSTNGYFDIIMPALGTVITGLGGASNATSTASGIPLAAYQALYYILPIGSGNTSLDANFRIVSYTGAFVVPETWVLLAVVSDGFLVKWGSGQGQNWNLTGNTGTVPGTQFLGTNDNASLSFRTNGVERVRIDSSTGNVGFGTTTPFAQLQLSNSVVNRKIVLYDQGTNAGNDSAFFGFGVNNSKLRYQVPFGSSHSFYNSNKMVATLDQYGNLSLTGSSPALFTNDRTRSNRTNAFYSQDGVARIWGSQNGDLITVDSIGNAQVLGKLRIQNLPATPPTNLLTTDASGNIGQTTFSNVVRPTLIGVGNQGANGITITSTTTGLLYTGYSITIPANSKYFIKVNMLVPPNGAFTAGNNIWIRSALSTTSGAYTSNAYAVSGGGTVASALVNSDNYQMLEGVFTVNNTTNADLPLYYFAGNVAITTSGYTGSIIDFGKNVWGENSIIGIPIN